MPRVRRFDPPAISLLQLATAAGEAGVARRPKRTASSYREYQQQCLFAQACDLHPIVNTLAYTASIQGVNLSPRAARQAKTKGVRRGAPDWMLFARGRTAQGQRAVHCGLALEFKDPHGKGRISADQNIFAAKLREAGWRVEYPTTAEEAWGILCHYLGIKES